MKKLLLCTVLLSGLQIIQAQDPMIYDTWYLFSYKDTQGEVLFISDVEPTISPSLSIDNDLSYSGNAACNDFNGSFLYDGANDKLILEVFVPTTSNCDFSSHTQFESDFFAYFQPGETYNYFVTTNFFYLETETGGVLTYRRDPLSTEEFELAGINIYPNPAADRVQVHSKERVIESVAIYSINGVKILEESLKSGSLDVSNLSKGIYFMEIQTKNERVIKKFMKN